MSGLAVECSSRTVSYPFVAPETITDDFITILAGAVRFVRRSVAFLHGRAGLLRTPCAWTEPVQPFRQLTVAVWRAFPQHPPYGGAYDDVVPHLTITE